MANTTLFSSKRNPQADTVNQAGGTAFSVSDEHALCQYVVTGTFNQTYYASAKEQLETVQKLVEGVSSQTIAKAAVYGRETGKMKDVPSYLMAVLASRKEAKLLRQAWPRVIVNVKMLLNFVQIIRSGATGRTSFGSAPKELIQDWITSKNDKQLLNASIGHSNPSLADVIKMVHPKPRDEGQSAAFAYIIGKDVNVHELPRTIRHFELFKEYNQMVYNKDILPGNLVDELDVSEVPDVQFQALTNCNLTKSQWKSIALNMPWNTLRMNINMLHKNGVFEDEVVLDDLAAKLSDPEQVRKNNAFPYQLLTAYKFTQDAPFKMREALQDAMEIATENVPLLGNVAVCVDTSGSMQQPVTGGMRHTNATETKCMDVASLIAASIARTNKTAEMVAWASEARAFKFNPRDSIMTISSLFEQQNVGMGTDASKALEILNQNKSKADLVVIITDNQSWMHDQRVAWNRSSSSGKFVAEWKTYKGRNRKAKLVVIDVVGNDTVVIPDDKDILNIGGFNDSVFNVISRFVGQGASFVGEINSVDLRSA